MDKYVFTFQFYYTPNLANRMSKNGKTFFFYVGAQLAKQAVIRIIFQKARR